MSRVFQTVGRKSLAAHGTLGVVWQALGALLVLFLACAPFSESRAESLTTDQLTVVTQTGRHDFTVENAVTPGERSVGLMNRQEMAPDHGMLFHFEIERPVAFWMKSTFIPLDMFFIDTGGTIVGIHRNAVPHDETPIRSPAPARYVLELNAGLADEIGAKAGDRIEHSAIGE